MKKMDLSIITVCLNAKPLLEKTMRSLAQQTCVQFEWIVVDGVSTDGSLELIHNSPLVSHWISEKDKGIYDAMNKGMSLATRGYLMFLNAGDVLNGDFFSKIEIQEGLIPVKTTSILNKEYLIQPKSSYFGLPYNHQGFVFKNSEIRYDLKYKITADFKFYLSQNSKEKSFPLRFLVTPEQGFIFYDNHGFSAQRYMARDQEISSLVREHFGLFRHLVFEVYWRSKHLIKLALKKLRK